VQLYSLRSEKAANFAETYPYASPFQFLHTFLNKKEPSAETIRSRAAIQFSNSLWYEYQMDNADKEMLDAMPAEKTEIQLSSTPESKDLLFEPLHMVDYFASQGIKVSGFLENKDQLSVKLKSFTEWLRIMKRIHPETIPESIDQKEELQIRQTAESSNKGGTVLTETMAEVYIQQGLTGKAIEIYQKLSLLDPAKSTYFATLINKLPQNP
jgi:hypothetical protein